MEGVMESAGRTCIQRSFKIYNPQQTIEKKKKMGVNSPCQPYEGIGGEKSYNTIDS